MSRRVAYASSSLISAGILQTLCSIYPRIRLRRGRHVLGTGGPANRESTYGTQGPCLSRAMRSVTSESVEVQILLLTSPNKPARSAGIVSGNVSKPILYFNFSKMTVLWQNILEHRRRSGTSHCLSSISCIRRPSISCAS